MCVLPGRGFVSFDRHRCAAGLLAARSCAAVRQTCIAAVSSATFANAALALVYRCRGIPGRVRAHLAAGGKCGRLRGRGQAPGAEVRHLRPYRRRELPLPGATAAMAAERAEARAAARAAQGHSKRQSTVLVRSPHCRIAEAAKRPSCCQASATALQAQAQAQEARKKQGFREGHGM